MMLEQALIVGLLLGLLAVFALDRFRVEVVALIGLGAGVAFGLVPMDRAFAGVSNPAVITVVEVLLIVQALDRSHVVDRLTAWLRPRLRSPRRLLLGLCLAGAAVSSVMNNIGAYALMLPVAFSLSRGVGLAPRAVLMPLAFATLLGGLWTLVGTPANLIVSEALRAATGDGFRFLDFAPTGIAVTLVGLAVTLAWAPSALPEAFDPVEPRDDALGQRMVTEVRLPENGSERTLGALAARVDGEIHGVLRGDRRVFPLRPESALHGGDLVLLEADGAALQAALATGELVAARAADAAAAAAVDAVIMPQSMLVGSRVATVPAFAEREVRVVAVTTPNPRVEGGLDELRLGVGDVLHLQGDPMALRDAVEETGLMQLVPAARLEGRGFSPVPVAVFALGILAAALGLAPPEIAFGAVVLALVVLRALDLRVALAELNWPIVLLLVAMLPLGEAVARTGAATTIAVALTGVVPVAAPLAVCTLVLGLAMLITPFVNNATTAVILGPIALEIAAETGTSPALLLMAVAIGASCDFLTPIGHHNNTLAYGLGGYRFLDFPRLGWPVSVASLVVGVASCVLVWG